MLFTKNNLECNQIFCDLETVSICLSDTSFKLAYCSNTNADRKVILLRCHALLSQRLWSFIPLKNDSVLCAAYRFPLITAAKFQSGVLYLNFIFP